MGRPTLSDHVKTRMASRGVTEVEIWLTIQQPDYKRPGGNGATNYFKKLNGRTVRVTVGQDLWDTKKKIIVTVAIA